MSAYKHTDPECLLYWDGEDPGVFVGLHVVCQVAGCTAVEAIEVEHSDVRAGALNGLLDSYGWAWEIAQGADEPVVLCPDHNPKAIARRAERAARRAAAEKAGS